MFSRFISIMVVLSIVIFSVLFTGVVYAQDSINIQEDTIKENETSYCLDIIIPSVNGMEDGEFQSLINKLIQDRIIKSRDEIISSALEFEKDCETFGWEIQPYKIVVDYKAYYNKKHSNILSLVVRTYLYTGGMNGNLYYDTYNIDLDKNKLISLKDLFLDDKNYIQKINGLIKEQIKLKKSQGISFYENFAQFDTIDPSQDFYIKDNKLYIVFEKGIIAPRSQGTIEFKIMEIDKLATVLYPVKIEDNIIPIKPIIEGNNLMLPFRHIVEQLGYEVVWIGDINMIVIYKGEKWATISIGEDICANNITSIYKLNTASKLIGSNTYVSSDFFTCVLGVEIEETDNYYSIEIKN